MLDNPAITSKSLVFFTKLKDFKFVNSARGFKETDFLLNSPTFKNSMPFICSAIGARLVTSGRNISKL